MIWVDQTNCTQVYLQKTNTGIGTLYMVPRESGYNTSFECGAFHSSRVCEHIIYDYMQYPTSVLKTIYLNSCAIFASRLELYHLFHFKCFWKAPGGGVVDLGSQSEGRLFWRGYCKGDDRFWLDFIIFKVTVMEMLNVE